MSRSQAALVSTTIRRSRSIQDRGRGMRIA